MKTFHSCSKVAPGTCNSLSSKCNSRPLCFERTLAQPVRKEQGRKEGQVLQLRPGQMSPQWHSRSRFDCTQHGVLHTEGSADCPSTGFKTKKTGESVFSSKVSYQVWQLFRIIEKQLLLPPTKNYVIAAATFQGGKNCSRLLGDPFVLMTVSFAVRKLFSLMQSHLFIFRFVFLARGDTVLLRSVSEILLHVSFWEFDGFRFYT